MLLKILALVPPAYLLWAFFAVEVVARPLAADP
jgi:hypothetical protein